MCTFYQFVSGKCGIFTNFVGYLSPLYINKVQDVACNVLRNKIYYTATVKSLA